MLAAALKAAALAALPPGWTFIKRRI